MSFLPYPKYKDSGIDWLDEVPKHWGVLQSKRLLTRRKDLNTGMICENRLALTMNGVVPRALDDLEGLQASEFETYQIFKKDDLAFKLIDLQNIKTSRVGIVPEMGIMSPAYIRLEANLYRMCPKFGYWYFTDLYNRQVFNELGGGVRQTLGYEELLVLPCIAPPIGEQQAITDFLDRETEKIDTLVAEQEKLIELLKEKRQAVISHAVTKGLNPNAKMRDSGIEWLGKVPKHWETLTVRRISLSVQTGGTPSVVLPSEELEVGFLWFTPGDFGQRLRLVDSARKTTLEAVRSGDAKCFPSGSVLIVSIGATLGKVGFAEFPSSANQQINAVIPSNDMEGYFLAYSLSVKDEVMRYLSNASTIGIMNQEKTKDIWLAVPPLEEQKEITNFLDCETDKIDALVNEAERAIELLKERRNALISAAVTGKIDVRHLSTAKEAA